MVENKLPVKIAIINNNFLGMVRQWQQFFYESSYVATEYSHNPDFVKLAEAFGILGIRVTKQDQVESAINQAMEYEGPVIVDFVVEAEETGYPMIPSGQTVHDMIEEPRHSESQRIS